MGFLLKKKHTHVYLSCLDSLSEKENTNSDDDFEVKGIKDHCDLREMTRLEITRYEGI